MTLRDALHTAITFDVFNRHADKIEMANVAQTINCIHSLFLAQEEKYTRTPPYYVFEMYRPHMGAQQLPMDDPRRRADRSRPGRRCKDAGAVGLRVDSRQARDRHADQPVDRRRARDPDPIRRRRERQRGPGTVLTHDDMRARNTFDKPDDVRPASLPVKIDGAVVLVDLPKHSVAALELQLV